MTSYPQAPPMTDDEVTSFLTEAPIARLASRNPDGTIHLAPAWFLYDDGYILIGTQLVTRKARNVAAEPQVTVLIDTQASPFKGVIMYGAAELDREDAAAKRVPIFAKYVTPERAEQMATGLAEQFEPVIIRVRPDRVISYDYAKLH